MSLLLARLRWPSEPLSDAARAAFGALRPRPRRLRRLRRVRRLGLRLRDLDLLFFAVFSTERSLQLLRRRALLRFFLSLCFCCRCRASGRRAWRLLGGGLGSELELELELEELLAGQAGATALAGALRGGVFGACVPGAAGHGPGVCGKNGLFIGTATGGGIGVKRWAWAGAVVLIGTAPGPTMLRALRDAPTARKGGSIPMGPCTGGGGLGGFAE